MSQIDQNMRGSKWRKWDLQVHTPFSHLNNGFGDNFDEYVKKLFKAAIEKQVAVIGITDYFCIEGYKKIKQDYLSNDTKLAELFTSEEIEQIKKITIFPNIEFRLDTLVNGNRVNFHVIFSDEVPITDIEENFLHDLDFIYEGNPQGTDEKWKLKISNLEELGKKLKNEHTEFQSDSDLFIGMKCAVVSHSQIAEILTNKKSKFEGTYLMCVPSDEDLSAISWNGQDHNVRKIYIQKSDALISSNAATIDWGLGKKHENPQQYIDEFKSLKPCVWGSDCHVYDKLFEPDNQRYTWIKADPTFEGLKQLLYEPSERVKIQEVNPSYEYNKPYFSELTISDEVGIFDTDKDQVYFSKTSLPLNKNLVSIIGGRGMGKSMLVDYWAHLFKNHRPPDSTYSNSENFDIFYAKDNLPSPTTENYKGGAENYLDFIYIPQRRLKEVSEKGAIAGEVKKLLKIEDLFFSQSLDRDVQETLKSIDDLQSWFAYEDEEGRKLNDKTFVESQKKRSEELLKSITTEKNKKKLATYTANINEIRVLESKVTALDTLSEELTETQNAFNQDIEENNKTLDESKGFKKIPQVDFKLQNEAIAHDKWKLLEQKKEKEEQNQTIKSEFEQEGFTGDLSSLLDNAKTYQSNIQWAEKQLEAIAKQETALTNALTERESLGEKIKSEYERQKSEIDRAWSGILDNHGTANKALIEKILLKEGKIAVQGEIVFDEEAFYNKLLATVDRRTFRDKQALKSKFKIHSLEDWVNFISTSLKEYLEGENAERYVSIVDVFFGLKDRGEYLKTIPKITYGGKRLDQLSVGQRGTVYLCLKLATDAFSKPIIFDQPEDDLDNEFIMNELIDIFKELKKYRQIIIVTHNANLVVNADAEQVIIANNTEEKLSYSAGALENPEIIANVCKILEGGKEAFERRKNKYSLK